MTGIRTRLAREEDIDRIQEMFRLAYGSDYAYRDFYDREWLKRSIYGDRMVVAVAEDVITGQVVGTGSVDMDIGAHSDLVGELGRLVVHPDARGRGVGTALMRYRLEFVQDRLHVAIIDNRTAQPYTQKMALKLRCASVGFLPLKHRFSKRESIATFARHFSPALDLRRNHPRVVPAVAPMAHLAMNNVALASDVIVDESISPHPWDDDFRVSAFDSERMPDLLRIARGRVRERDVFGPMRLHYGFFKLTARQASFLVARRPGAPRDAIAGALGFLHDDGEKNIQIFELIAASDASVRFLFQSLLERARELGVEYIEVEVSAHGTRLQRTLLELGFLPGAYIPAMVFHEVERLDVVKMVRLLVPPTLGEVHLEPEVRPIFEEVMGNFRTRAVLPRISASIGELAIFEGLNDEQARRFASAMTLREYEPGDVLFRAGEEAEEFLVLIEGRGKVLLGTGNLVGEVGAGDVVGENALLAQARRTGSVEATEAVVAAVMTRDRLREIRNRRPDIAVVLYRNLARELGRKLREADITIDRNGQG